MVVMNSEQNPPKGQDPAAAGKVAEPMDKDLIALEDLDKVIAAEDPEFKERVDGISTDAASVDGSLELLDLDQLLAEQEAKSLRSRLKKLGRKGRNFVVGLRATAWDFLKNDLPVLLKTGLGKLKVGLASLGELLRQFGFKPRRFKLLVFAFAGISVAVTVAMFLLITRGIPEEEPLFMRSLSEIADGGEEYDPQKQEIFYESVRAAQNVLVIPRLLVNLKRSPGSGPNPMAMGEIYVEGNSPDVVVEIKMRETEFRDLFMRTMEEFNADDLQTAVGKEKLLERFAREANRVVTKGRVRKVFFKTFVLKP